MAFFKKLKDRLFNSSSKLDEGLEAILQEGDDTEAQAPARPSAFAAANDDTQKDYKSFAQSISKPVPNTVYWAVALLSVVWAASGLLMGHLLFSPQIWRASGLSPISLA